MNTASITWPGIEKTALAIAVDSESSMTYRIFSSASTRFRRFLFFAIKSRTFFL